MEQLLSLLDSHLFSFRGEDFNVSQVLLVPLFIWLAYFLFHKSSALILGKLQQRQVAQQQILLVKRIYTVLALVIVVITLLELLHIPLTAFAFISGAVAIGVGFGAQNIINNFISGWILMWEQPIRIGDFLEIGDAKGTVETINSRSTLIRRTDGVHLLIPNSQFLENMVVNWTLIDKLARGVVRVGVAYGSPVKKVSTLISRAAEHPDVLRDPAPLVVFEDFGDSALIFDLFFWINAFGEKDLRVIRSDIRFKIDELFAENDIVIAFPQRDIHIDGRLSIARSPKANASDVKATAPQPR
ncbi:MAG: mechanosensitive ion channel [Pseudomonadales bacterium]|nr:mechanosensitive ion channel [Pseudomonadales bacterium]